MSLFSRLLRNAQSQEVCLKYFGKSNPQTFSYADVSARAERGQVLLRKMKITPGDRVGVMLPRNIDNLSVSLAIWSCGAVVVPLFTALGKDAVEIRAKHSGMKLIVTNDDYLAHIPPVEECQVYHFYFINLHLIFSKRLCRILKSRLAACWETFSHILNMKRKTFLGFYLRPARPEYRKAFRFL
jgi:acyl-coenzyme A synthetase/AMP-(fatty) acid ligase